MRVFSRWHFAPVLLLLFVLVGCGGNSMRPKTGIEQDIRDFAEHEEVYSWYEKGYILSIWLIDSPHREMKRKEAGDAGRAIAKVGWDALDRDPTIKVVKVVFAERLGEKYEKPGCTHTYAVTVFGEESKK